MEKKRWVRLSASLSAWTLTVLAVFFLHSLQKEHKYDRSGRPWPYVADAWSYYVYLPGLLIHGDLDWKWASQHLHYEGPPVIEHFGPFRSPHTGRWVNKYSVGTALLHAPGFVLAHAWALRSDKQPADGFSPPYRLAGALTGILWLMIGLAFIRKTVLHFADEVCASLVLLLLALGTNLFHYSLYEPGMSHVYGFAALAMILWYNLRWHERGRIGDLLALAAALGIAFLIRPTLALFVLFPLLWGLTDWRAKRALLRGKWPQLLAGFALGLLVCLPQLIYWKIWGGRWLYYSYGGEGFVWAEPMLGEVLWGYRKGWFIYTPAALLMVAGLLPLRRMAPQALLPVLVCVVLSIYIAASWWCWWYGGSFGMRALIELYAPLSIALAAFIQAMRQKLWQRIALAVLLLFCLQLNLLQSRQYRRDIIHWGHMTKTVYWKVFGRLRIPAEELKEIHHDLAEPEDWQRRRYRAQD